MKIVKKYSHLNGEEFLLVHHKKLLEEIIEVIESIDSNKMKTKISKEKNKIGEKLFSPVDLNRAFKNSFNKKGWKEHRISYYMTDNEKIARLTMELDKQEQKKIIEKEKLLLYNGSNQTDFMKNKIAIEVQFGKYAFIAYDLFVKHMAFYTRNEIDCGIEIVPTKNMQKKMSSGVGCYEGEVYNIYRQSRGTPSVPLLILGIDEN